MYVNSLGATPRCLSLEQSAEAARLCNCKVYGHPAGPVSGLGAARADYTSDAYSGGINIQTDTTACDPRPKVRMPADFDPDDPCEGTSRKICTPTLSRPGQQTSASTPSPPAHEDFDFQAFEESEADRALMQQRFVVFGLLGAVLVGGGYLVYRVTRK